MRAFAVLLVSLLSGLLFGVGLMVSGMANPAKVLGFLDLAGRWDPDCSTRGSGHKLVRVTLRRCGDEWAVPAVPSTRSVSLNPTGPRGGLGGTPDLRGNEVTCLIGGACLLAILLLRRWLPSVPGILVAVVGATLAVALLDLDKRAGVAVVGSVPQGLPMPSFPAVPFDQIFALVPGALAIGLISLADISVLSRVFAERSAEHVDRDQELVALGACNIVAGMFQGFPVTGSSSRTPVAESAGAKTQLTGVVAALCVAALLIFAPALLRTLPQAALGAVVVAAGLGLFEIHDVFRLLRLRRSEFLQSMACFAGVALIGPIQGIFIAVGLALMAFVWRAWRPYDAVLGRVYGRKGYHDMMRHPDARTIPGLVLYRWDAPLFFANAEIFRDHVQRAIDNASPPASWVVVAAEPITDVDVTASELLRDFHAGLHERQIELCFAEMKGPVKDMLQRYGLFDVMGEQHFFPTLGVAVDAYLAQHDVEWRDWEDEREPPSKGQQT
ncbi:DUF6691 family protein [Paraburkholderia phymatum]|uniref:Sulphate transporter n=1 Tax=Paraburkholderia phymatum (strain DSM 17167 / CIP 108236 / LMG 21445 / STM815) TaxID=391038 RepID=B2JV97_PARP8|nr:DUF6691 family protein [Paraburkholderia phymatum]ACC74874.1 sulphate transporter [Paraburkholderia phymatum STM815]